MEPRSTAGTRMVRVGPVHGAPALLREFGVDPAGIIASSGLDPRDLADAEALVPFRSACQLLARCVSATGCQHFGLLLGRTGGSVALGLVGLASRHQPDVRSALHLLVEFLRVHDQGGGVTYSQQDGFVRLGYVIYEQDAPARDQVLDLALAIGLTHLRQLCGSNWNPTQMTFQRRRPQDTRPWLALSRGPVEFDSEQSSIVFPAAWLDHPVEGADPVLRRILEGQLRQIDASVRTALSDEIERVVKPMLGTKSSVERAARLLGVNRRTLARRLAREDTSFREVQQRARFSTAKDMLSGTDMPLAEIAIVLGYSDASAFTRAFHRWSGMSPSAWRRTARAELADGHAAKSDEWPLPTAIEA